MLQKFVITRNLYYICINEISNIAFNIKTLYIMSYYKSDAEQIQDLADAQLNRYLDSLEEDIDPRDILEEQSECGCCGATLYTEDYRDSDFDYDVASNEVWVFCLHCDDSTELKVKK